MKSKKIKETLPILEHDVSWGLPRKANGELWFFGGFQNTGDTIQSFLSESLRIEGIYRKPTEAEYQEFLRFMNLEAVTVKELKKFVDIYQPGSKLRSKKGMNVRVGVRSCMPGGPDILNNLKALLLAIENMSSSTRIEEAFYVHSQYELLHPFTDCNGRSGRMLWCWMMGRIPKIGFLHKFYYQALNYMSGESFEF